LNRGIPTLFVVSVVVFGLRQMLPGDAAIALAGEDLAKRR
jgi:ABC-type dipeptide/oligopeptide/nickel transport system permease component